MIWKENTECVLLIALERRDVDTLRKQGIMPLNTGVIHVCVCACVCERERESVCVWLSVYVCVLCIAIERGDIDNPRRQGAMPLNTGGVRMRE